MHFYVDSKLDAELPDAIKSPDLLPMMRTLTLAAGFSGFAVWKKVEEMNGFNVRGILSFFGLEEMLKLFGVA